MNMIFEQYRVYIISAAALVLVGLIYTFGAHNANNACDAEKLEVQSKQLEEKQKIEELNYKKALANEEWRMQIQQKNDDLQRRLRNEIKTDDAYKRAIPVNGLQLLSEAIDNANAR